MANVHEEIAQGLKDHPAKKGMSFNILVTAIEIGGSIGLIFLGSCVVVRKPVVFYMAQRYGTDGSHDGMATFDKMWTAYRDFRTGMYATSYLWAALFLIQAGVTALIISQTSFSTAYNYDQILPLVAIGLGIAGSVVVGQHYTKKGRARRETPGAGSPGPA